VKCVFISYAHGDGGSLAARLQRDLEGSGFDVWRDKSRLQAGDRWTNEVEAALDRAEVVLALLSEGSFTSDTCRAEQVWALDAGKRVIPVKVQRDCKGQLRLQNLQWLDFSDLASYDERFQELLKGMGERGEVLAAAPFHNNAPPPPDNFVDRPEILARLRDALFQDAPHRNIAVTALLGMGGIGKTVLAQALCQQAEVQHTFPAGIFWFTIGKESRLRFDQRLKGVPELNQLLGAYQGEEACVSQYRNALQDRAALIVLDDVWRAFDIEPFQTESPRSRLLITTRDADIASSFGAREFTAELPAHAEAREVLAKWAGLANDSLPPQAEEVIGECGSLPLALAMIGAQLRGKPSGYWDLVLGYLRHADMAKIKARFPEPHTGLFRAIQVSVDALQRDDPVAAQDYLALAVLLEDMAAAPAVQRTIWNVDETKALETAERLVGLSLAQRDAPSGGIRLHGLQMDYVRAQYPDPEALALILGAVRLSAHVIEKDPRQFASQVVGRLLPHREVPAIQLFIDEIAAGAPRPWLRLLHPALDPPGGPLLRTLEGHSSFVSGVAVTPDGKFAVSASADKTLKVWDLDSGRALRTLKGHSDDVTGVAVTPDGRRAVSASEDRTLKVWDLDTGQALLTLEGHSDQVTGVAVTADGKRAVSASEDKTLKVWDLNSGRALRTLKGHSHQVTGVAVTADGKRAVSASWDESLKVWDLDTGRVLRTLAVHSASVSGVAVTLDGKRVISTSWDGTLKVWDLETGDALRTLANHSRGVTGVAVTADGKCAVSASWDNTLKVWNLETGRELQTLEGHLGPVSGVAVTPDGKCVVSASHDKTLKVWDLETGGARRTLAGHSNRINGMAMTVDGKGAVSASDDGTLKVWDMKTGGELLLLAGRSGAVHSVAVTPNGKCAVCAFWDKTLKVLGLGANFTLRTLQGHSGPVFGVSVTPDGRRAVSASADKTLKVWDLGTGRELGTLEGHSEWVYGVAVTPDGTRAVSASWDHTLMVWDLETGGALGVLTGHSDRIYSVAVMTDGKHAVSASGDQTLKIWDLDTGRALRTLAGHSDTVQGVAVTADGKRAVSASWDHTVKVWDLDTAQLFATFYCDPPVRCCVFADARRIVAGDSVGRVYFLSIEE